MARTTKPKNHDDQAKPKNHWCDWSGCRQAFGRSADMIRHRRSVHLGIKEYPCTEEGCGKRFSQKTSVKTHMRTHTGERPYTCEKRGCLKKFTDSSSCKRHYREQHLCLTFACPWCYSDTRRISMFQKHLRDHHQVENAKTMGVENLYLLSEHYTTEDLGYLPQYRGLPGIELRKKKPRIPNDWCHKCPLTKPIADMLPTTRLIRMARASSQDSLASTPALSLASVSPTPSFEDVNSEIGSVEPQQYHVNGNELGLDFGAENHDPYLSPLSIDPDLNAIRESTAGSYASHMYAPMQMHDDQFLVAQGWDQSCMAPQLVAPEFTVPGSDPYERVNDMTLPMPPLTNQVFQPGWHMGYTPSISRLSRSSQAHASGWV